MSTHVIVVKDKHETYVIDASDMAAALLEVFGIFDGNEYYCDLVEPDAWDVAKPGRMKQWYAAAKTGDAKAAKALLNWRHSHGYEYEDHWRVHELIVPEKARRVMRKECV